MTLAKKRIRRNVIVRNKGGTFYGRVIRMLPDGRVFWLCCGYHFHITPVDQLIADGYKGTASFYGTRFIYMTTLRRLKKRAQRFHYDFAHNTPLDYELITHD